MNIVLIDKSEFQVKYLWDKGISILDKAVQLGHKHYSSNVDAIICYLDSEEYENLRDALPRDFCIYRVSTNTLPKELEPMCRRWVQYGGVHFMEKR